MWQLATCYFLIFSLSAINLYIIRVALAPDLLLIYAVLTNIPVICCVSYLILPAQIIVFIFSNC